MQPVVVTAGDLLVAGIKLRTTQRIEAVGQTAKIPALWRKFLVDKAGEQIPDRLPDPDFLAVYTDYDRDDAGPYSLVIGQKVRTLERLPKGISGIWILPGRYLRFDIAAQRGAYPAEAWEVIRRFFTLTHAYERAYTADYEVHAAAAVSICVSIK
jgi:predicted transcriptional regulator YdeE